MSGIGINMNCHTGSSSLARFKLVKEDCTSDKKKDSEFQKDNNYCKFVTKQQYHNFKIQSQHMGSTTCTQTNLA